LEKDYDVIIIGAGPAGIFASREIALNSSARVLLLEKGRDVEKRRCPIGKDTDSCINCRPCSIMCGWGGAGAFSDGKLTLTTYFGGWLDEYIGKDRLQQLINYVDAIYVQHGAPNRVYGQDEENLEPLMERTARANLRLLPAYIRHMGTDNTLKVLASMRKELKDKVTIKTGAGVEDILVREGRVTGVKTSQGSYYAPRVICAPGRDGPTGSPNRQAN
jgi:uncharacterized FAD-dependent dehydrogenase